MRLRHSIWITVLIILLTACASVSVKTDYDTNQNFSKYKTYKWYEGESAPGDALVQNPLLKKRVMEAVDAELEAKGFVHNQKDTVDFIVFAHAGVKDKLHVTNWNHYGWYDPWWGPYGGRVEVSQYTEGTLIIDIVNAASKELAWRGLGTSIVRDYSGPDERKEAINDYVRKILKDFPPENSR